MKIYNHFLYFYIWQLQNNDFKVSQTQLGTYLPTCKTLQFRKLKWMSSHHSCKLILHFESNSIQNSISLPIVSKLLQHVVCWFYSIICAKINCIFFVLFFISLADKIPQVCTIYFAQTKSLIMLGFSPVYIHTVCTPTVAVLVWL